MRNELLLVIDMITVKNMMNWACVRTDALVCDDDDDTTWKRGDRMLVCDGLESVTNPISLSRDEDTNSTDNRASDGPRLKGKRRPSSQMSAMMADVFLLGCRDFRSSCGSGSIGQST
jgi:hypothetical protein